jgi:hypothetical protein
MVTAKFVQILFLDVKFVEIKILVLNAQMKEISIRLQIKIINAHVTKDGL